MNATLMRFMQAHHRRQGKDDSMERRCGEMPYGTPNIDQSAHVARNATIVGDVTIGAECTVLYGATLRGDCGGRVHIGDRTNVQELACVHVPLGEDTVIGSDVTIGHGAILHGCRIGDGCVVGMGSIVLDGATIGRDCLIGAGSLVTGKTDAPDRSLLMGSPATVVRELTDEEAKGLRVNSEEYLRIGQELEEEGLL